VLAAPAWWAIAPLLVLGPPGYQWLSPDTPAPEGVAALFQPGKINVLEFADFECPYCRRLHGVLGPVLEEYGDRVHFRRLHRPLPSHPMADLAARAGICAEQAGQGEAMADRLFSIQLSPRSIRSAAAELRLDLDALDACTTSAATDATLRAHEALLPDGELQGLPTTFVGGEAIVGAVTPPALRDALDRAAHARPASAAAPAFLGVWAALLALCAYFGRLSAADAERRRSPADPSAG
jgi:protein-disulfide isomerase